MSIDSTNLIYAEKRSSQWELLMRKFCEVHKADSVYVTGSRIDPHLEDIFFRLLRDHGACNSAEIYSEIKRSKTVEIPTVYRSEKVFPTHSKYEGTWNVLGISGYGIYTFPNGVVYEGQFYDGMFEGEGEMRYPNGTKLRGVWSAGLIVDPILVFSEDIQYDEEDWAYCRHPDRRFSIECARSIQPCDKSFLVNDKKTRKVPDGYYDTGDGFYHPISKMVYRYTDLAAIVRTPVEDEQEWIVENCRTSPDLSIGPGSGLYEQFQRPRLRLYEDKGNEHEASMKNFYDPESEERRMSDETVGSIPQKLMVPSTLFAFQNSPYLSF